MTRHLLSCLTAAGIALAGCKKSEPPAASPAAPASPAPASPAPTAAAAPSAQGSEHTHTAPHGGVLQDTPQGHLELVASRDGNFMLYVLGPDLKVQTLSGASATLKLTVPGYADVKLTPMGNHLHGVGKPFTAEHPTAVVSVTNAGSTQTARFALHLEAEGHGPGGKGHGGEGHGADGHQHGAAGGALPGGFKAELKTTPAQAVAGQPAQLTFTVKDAKGAVVRELPLSHEKPMHLLAVSKDLASFAHLHPDPAESGVFRTEHSFPTAGEYLLFADYTPEGSPQVVDRFSVKVDGTPRAPVKLVQSASPTQTVDGLRLTLKTQEPLRAGGQGSVLRFDVADAKTGAAVTDLEPYLGAMAHFVLISEDTQHFLHAHPLEEPGAKVSSVSAHTRFPEPGLYKVWVQVQRRGQVVTVPYVLRVSGGEPEASAQPAPVRAAHADHGH